MPDPTSKYSKELVEEICLRISLGETLSSICSEKHMPHKIAIHRWLHGDKHPEFNDMYDRARQNQMETWADDIIDIADDGTNDYVEKISKNGHKYISFDHENVTRSKLRVDSRKWIMAKRNSKKWGETKQLDIQVKHYRKTIILDAPQKELEIVATIEPIEARLLEEAIKDE